MQVSFNPFRRVVRFQFQEEAVGGFRLNIYTQTGSLVYHYEKKGFVDKGFRYAFDAKFLAPGVYCYEIQFDDRICTSKLIKLE